MVPVKSGLRQGCSLSPLLFNLFINDLALRLKSLGKGLHIDNKDVCLLLYADDLVLLAENAEDLKSMLHELSSWCDVNNMHVNTDKSNIVHFRPNSCPLTYCIFRCGDSVIKVVDRYVYLGLTLHEHLDFNITAKVVAQSAGRALGLLIAKSKCIGGMPYDVFTKLYDSMVNSVISYGAAIWGYKKYSCIEAIQNRAMRFFLGTGKYTPNAAVSGDMAWYPAYVTQWKSICSHWSRHVTMPASRMNTHIFRWAYTKADQSRTCRNWFRAVTDKFRSIGLDKYKHHRMLYFTNRLYQGHYRVTNTITYDRMAKVCKHD